MTHLLNGDKASAPIPSPPPLLRDFSLFSPPLRSALLFPYIIFWTAKICCFLRLSQFSTHCTYTCASTLAERPVYDSFLFVILYINNIYIYILFIYWCILDTLFLLHLSIKYLYLFFLSIHLQLIVSACTVLALQNHKAAWVWGLLRYFINSSVRKANMH